MNGTLCTGRRDPAPRSPRTDAGFTLTELVVTISIASILAVLAVPSFNGVITTERTKGAASDLFASLVTARSEAIRLDKQITIQAATGGWQAGWSTSTVVNGVNTSLDSHGATHVDSIAEQSGATKVTYYPSGRLALGVSPVFVISKQNAGSTVYQCVSIDPAGAPFMQAGQTC